MKTFLFLLQIFHYYNLILEMVLHPTTVFISQDTNTTAVGPYLCNLRVFILKKNNLSFFFF